MERIGFPVIEVTHRGVVRLLTTGQYEEIQDVLAITLVFLWLQGDYGVSENHISSHGPKLKASRGRDPQL